MFSSQDCWVVSCSENSATESFNEPLLGLLLGDSLEVSEGASSSSATSNSFSSAGKYNIEVHAVDTS